jgi:kynurenine formamidase
VVQPWNDQILAHQYGQIFSPTPHPVHCLAANFEPTMPRPPFADLPLDKNGPPGNAWGLYGPNDELGALNMITPATVLEAAKEIQTGDRVSLDWYLNLPSHPSFNRPPFQWTFKNKSHPDGRKRTVNDDHLEFNTQGSSQWDGFRHYGYQGAKRYYGGRTQEELENSEVIGIDRVVNSGGITARGIILDYPRYLQRKGREPVYALEANGITPDELKEMLLETGIQAREGDVLLLRTGFTRDYLKLNEQEKREMPDKPPAFLGVESSKATLQWIWESGFAAVASDAPSFEMAPLVGPHNAPGGMWKGEAWEEEMQGGGLVHQFLLGGWGVMIGEMWDLEALCERSEKLGRRTCFLSSVPLKVSQGRMDIHELIYFWMRGKG